MTSSRTAVHPFTSEEYKRATRCLAKFLPRSCSSFCTFFVFAVILVPMAVFALGAFFALPLWAIECDEVQDGVDDDAPATKDEMCSFYEARAQG